MKRLLLLVIIVAVVVAALFIGRTFPAANAGLVDLDLYWLRIPNLEVWWLTLLSAGLGAAMATLIVGFAWLRSRLLNRRFRKSLKKLEAEIHQLRSLPLATDSPEVVPSTETSSRFGKRGRKKKAAQVAAETESPATTASTPLTTPAAPKA